MAISVSPNVITNGLVFAYDMTNTAKSWKGKPITNLISNPTEEMARGEFGQYRDLAPIFNTNGLVPYSLSMDIKVNKPGYVSVYMQNGSSTKYSFVSSTVSATTEYQRFYFNNLTPAISNAADTAAWLATYTGYGSGVNPTVKNIQVELGTFATPFVDGTRSTTQSLIDLTGNQTITTSSLTYNSNNTFSFNGSSNYIDSNPVPLTGTSTQSLTWACWVRPASSSGDIINMVYPTVGWNMCPIWASGQIFYAKVWSNANLTSGATFNLNEYYYLALVRDSATNTNSFYINGQLAASQTGGYDSSGASNNHYFGRAGSQATSTYFNGLIPVGQIYTRALSASEVQQNFNATRTRYGR